MKRSPKPLWPDARACAVSLTFDDGRETQLATAVPLLDRRGMKATFYLSPSGDDWRARLDRWKPVSSSGHEIGNHSILHPGSVNLSSFMEPFDASRIAGVERMALSEAEKDIVRAEERLSLVFPRAERSFAYPCYADYVGSGTGRRSCVPVAAKHFIAARGTGEFGFNLAEVCDLHSLWSWRCEDMTYAELIGRVEADLPKGLWHIFTFHDIGDSQLATGRYHFTRFIDYLDRRRSEIWIAPVADAARRILEWRRENLKS